MFEDIKYTDEEVDEVHQAITEEHTATLSRWFLRRYASLVITFLVLNILFFKGFSPLFFNLAGLTYDEVFEGAYWVPMTLTVITSFMLPLAICPIKRFWVKPSREEAESVLRMSHVSKYLNGDDEELKRKVLDYVHEPIKDNKEKLDR